MQPEIRKGRHSRESGFSMVEMLMTAFVLSIGILGLSILQVMSIKATRGSQSLSTASQLAERVMDQIELEGRLTLLNITSTSFTGQAVPNLQYIGQNPGPQQFNLLGTAPVSASTDPKLRDPFFAVAVVQAPVGVGTQGTVEDARVTVVWTDLVDATNTAIQRQVVLTRRIVHG